MSNETTQYIPADVRERVKEPTQAQIDDACMWYRHDFGLLSEKERDSVRFEARQWFRAWGKALSNGDDYAALLRAGRGGRSALWWAANELVAALEGRSTLTVQQCITGVKRLLAEADLRTPRGEGEAWRAFLDALDEFEAAANLWADPEGPTAADMERLRQSRQRVIECARILAALRSEAQGEEV